MAASTATSCPTPGNLTASLPWRFSPSGTLKFRQAPREHDASGDNTGWCVWECSNVLLRAVTSSVAWHQILEAASSSSPASADMLRRICEDESAGGVKTTVVSSKPDDCPGPEELPGWLLRASVCDFSAGVGLVSIALASAGCSSTTATDIACQLPLLRSNIDAAVQSKDVTPECRPAVTEYWWGQPLGDLAQSAVHGPHTTSEQLYDLVLASDILFIALRDGVTGSLAASLRRLAHCCGAVLMAWEERLPEQEQQWLDALQAGTPCAGEHDAPGVDGSRGVPPQHSEDPPHKWHPCPVTISEFTGDMVTLQQEHAIDGVQGSVEGGTLVGDLFWEPPPIRMILITPLDPPTD